MSEKNGVIYVPFVDKYLIMVSYKTALSYFIGDHYNTPDFTLILYIIYI